MPVVATALETDARSKTLAMVTCGESGSKVNRPKAFRAISFPCEVTAIEAAGKACWAMALCNTSNASVKNASCRSYAGAGKGGAAWLPVSGEEELSDKGLVYSIFGL